MTLRPEGVVTADDRPARDRVTGGHESNPARGRADTWTARWWSSVSQSWRWPRPGSALRECQRSVRQVRRPGFIAHVGRRLAEAALPPERLTLEITESLLLGDDDEIWEDLKELRSWGVRVSIDDFGTGYSALGYLRQVPLDTVKLDRQFISTMATSSRQPDLVKGIVALVRTLGLDVVAEGIETTQQRDICAAIGCDYGQGYLFARSGGTGYPPKIKQVIAETGLGNVIDRYRMSLRWNSPFSSPVRSSDWPGRRG